MSFLKNLGVKPLQQTESLPINKESKVGFYEKYINGL